MNRRLLLTGLLTVLFAGGLWGVLGQHRQIVALRADEQRLLAVAPDESSSSSPTADAPAPAGTAPASRELLQLRSEAAQLRERRRELAGVEAENKNLRAQVAAAQTNAASTMKFPPGYIRKAQAQMVGYGSPNDTLQTFLWAIQQQDINQVVQALTPESGGKLEADVQRSENSVREFMMSAKIIPGAAVVDRQQLPDGSMALKVLLVPDQPPMPVIFKLINGEWKMEMPH